MKPIKAHIFILIIVVIACQSKLSACTCSNFDSVFCRNVSAIDHIVLANVLSFPEFYLMQVEIQENIYQSVMADTITILGQDGFNCSESLNEFEFGDTLIMALNGLIVNDSTIYWNLDGCGIHFLRYENGSTEGQITPDIKDLSLQEFKDNLSDCLSLPPLSTDETENPANQLNLYPNPVNEQLQINIANTQISAYAIFNATGQIESSQHLDQAQASHSITTNQLEKGIYFIRVHTPKGILVRRFLKV